ncbi:hypothetical protein E2C01_062295 [Portunus trituberculatus]|uniref:Uncharacterized protein n=1 Tax=Portunus trituberculatus TaxID=210409 RepID=A0A5B7HD90_PORTR|nr:hypothetical protein [Portunus trituberculatus]
MGRPGAGLLVIWPSCGPRRHTMRWRRPRQPRLLALPQIDASWSAIKLNSEAGVRVRGAPAAHSGPSSTSSLAPPHSWSPLPPFFTQFVQMLTITR